MELAAQDQELRAALFRLVDVTPACRSLDDLARHLGELPRGGGRAAAAARGRRDADVGQQGRAARRWARPRPRACATWRTASSSARRPRPPCARSAASGSTAPRCRSTCSARPPSPRPRPTATRRAAARRSTRSPRRRPAGRSGRRSSATRTGRSPRVNLSVKVSALTPLLRPEAPERGPRRRGAADAAAAAAGARAGRPPPHRHGVAWTPWRPPPSWSSSCSTSPSCATAPRPASCSRPTCATRATSSTACSTGPRERAPRPPLDGAARQGRLLGPRGGRGAPARLDAAGVRGRRPSRDRNFEELTRRLLDARDQRAAGDRLAQPALGRARDRLQPRDRRRGPRPRAAGAARPRRRAGRGARRARPARARSTARSATWSRAWPTSCGGCSRTPRTSRSSATSSAACRSTSCWRRREPSRTSRCWSCAGRRCASRCSRRCASSTRACRSRCRCSWAATAARRRASTPPTPASPTRLVATRRRARSAADAGAAVEAAERGFRDWGARPGGRARRGAAAAPRRGCASAALELAALQVRECAKPWARGRRRRLRGDRLPRVLRARGGRARARAGAAPGAGRAQHDALRAARRGGGDRALELPAGDPLRDDGRGAGRGQRGGPEAGRAVAGERADAWWRRCTAAGRARRTRSSLLPGFGEAGAALVRDPRVHVDRLHRLERGGPRDHPQRRPRRPRASTT